MPPKINKKGWKQKIRVKKHAQGRWEQLNMSGNPQHEVAWRLYEYLHEGVPVDNTGAIHLYIKEMVYAVVTLELWGGYSVNTFYIPGIILDDPVKKSG